jgi:hypothetical protein
MADNGVCVHHGAKVTAEGPDFHNRTFINALKGATGKQMLIARCRQMQVNCNDAAGKPMGIDAIRDIVLGLIPQQPRSSSSSAAAAFDSSSPMSVGISHPLSTLQTPFCSPTNVGVATPAESQAIIGTGDETNVLAADSEGHSLQFGSPTTSSSTGAPKRRRGTVGTTGPERKKQSVNPEVLEEEEGHGVMEE